MGLLDSLPPEVAKNPTIAALATLWDQQNSQGGSMSDVVAELGRRVMGARADATNAAGALSSAVNAPIPSTNPLADVIERSVGSAASGLLGSSEPSKLTADMIDAQQKELLQKRHDNLALLETAYSKAADRASKLGDLEAELKMRAQAEKASDNRQGLLQILRTQMEGETNKQVEAMRAASAERVAKIRSDQGISDSTFGSQVLHTAGDPNLGKASRPFLPLENFTGKAKLKAIEWAGANGVPVVTKEGHALLARVQAARENIDNILSDAKQLLPADPAARARMASSTTLAKLLQTKPAIAAFRRYRLAAIQHMTAISGGMGSGLRMYARLIDEAMSNDIPTEYDTYAVADAKLSTIAKLMSDVEDPIINYDWRNLRGALGRKAADANTPADTISTANDPLGLLK